MRAQRPLLLVVLLLPLLLAPGRAHGHATCGQRVHTAAGGSSARSVGQLSIWIAWFRNPQHGVSDCSHDSCLSWHCMQWVASETSGRFDIQRLCHTPTCATFTPSRDFVCTQCDPLRVSSIVADWSCLCCDSLARWLTLCQSGWRWA